MHTAKSGAPNLRSGEERPNTAQGVRPHPNPPPEGEGTILRWLRRNPALSGSPVLLRLAGGALPLFAIGIVLVIIAAALGPYTIPFSHTADILLEQVGIGQSAAPDTEQAIVASIRLPRIALALTVGAALGVAGAVMQGLFRNPMAAPGIIGVSTGGALGAVIAIAPERRPPLPWPCRQCLLPGPPAPWCWCSPWPPSGGGSPCRRCCCQA